MNSRVAVVITAFNSARFLKDAIASAVSQTRPPQEVIVVDDGSSDDPASVVAQFPGVRFIRQERGGPSAARNAGLKVTEADYVQFLDGDDVLLPIALESNLEILASNPGVGLVYGGHRRVDAARIPIGNPYFTTMTASPYHELLHGM